jgi:hypothetical protein
MGTLQNILESNGVYGLPPKQPIHKSQLRAGLQSLCKNNFDRKNYLNQEMKQNKILATFTKSTEKMERKPDDNANAISIITGTKSSKVEPALPAPPMLPAPPALPAEGEAKEETTSDDAYYDDPYYDACYKVPYYDVSDALSNFSNLERRRKLKFSKIVFFAISAFFQFVCLFTI